MKLHPLCLLFPKLEGEDFDSLVASMKARGYDPAFPIITLDDQILDGANRWRAAQKAHVELVTEPYRGKDPEGFVLAANLARRHLTASQRAMVAEKLATLKAGQRRGPEAASREAASREAAKSQAEAAAALKVSRASVQRARVVREQAAPELVKAVEQGRVDVAQAAHLARLPRPEQAAIAAEADERKRKTRVKDGQRKVRQMPKLAPAVRVKDDDQERGYTIAEWEALAPAERKRLITEGLENGRGALNEQTGEDIGWAWWSLNTVRGCKHGCPYCYARDIMVRKFGQDFETPLFYPGRLNAPAHTPFPAVEAAMPEDYAAGNIFANSMSDLFGAWVPTDWIEATIEMARRHAHWRFLTLTKYPSRVLEFDYPKNVWVGFTVDAQDRVGPTEKAAAALRERDLVVWLSLEPLLQRLTLTRPDLFTWVVIGGSSPSAQTPAWVPPFEWLVHLDTQFRPAGTRIYHKTNLGMGDALRSQEFPWITPVEKVLPKAFHYLKSLKGDSERTAAP